jgi:hypothetical protein
MGLANSTQVLLCSILKVRLRKTSLQACSPFLDTGNYNRGWKNGGPCRKLGSGSAQAKLRFAQPAAQAEAVTAQAQRRKWKWLMSRFRRRIPCCNTISSALDSGVKRLDYIALVEATCCRDVLSRPAPCASPGQLWFPQAP